VLEFADVVAGTLKQLAEVLSAGPQLCVLVAFEELLDVRLFVRRRFQLVLRTGVTVVALQVALPIALDLQVLPAPTLLFLIAADDDLLLVETLFVDADQPRQLILLSFELGDRLARRLYQPRIVLLGGAQMRLDGGLLEFGFEQAALEVSDLFAVSTVIH